MGRVLNENKLGFVRDLGANVNLNDLIEEGYYHQASNSSTSLTLNYPVVKAGLLTIVNRGYIYQTYHVYNDSDFFSRTFYDGTWFAWEKAVSSSPNVVAELSADHNGYVGWDNMSNGAEATSGASTSTSGSSQSTQSLLQPYITKYVWERVA